MLLVTVSMPELLIPAPEVALPWRIVRFARVTRAVVSEIATTVPTPPPSRIVVLAPEPKIFKLLPMLEFSVYVAAATRIVSPEPAIDTACRIVLHAFVDDVQLLLSLPLTPLMYHVVLAT